MTGALLGGAGAVLNFFLMSLTVKKSAGRGVQGKNRMILSYFLRMLLMVGVMEMCIRDSCQRDVVIAGVHFACQPNYKNAAQELTSHVKNISKGIPQKISPHCIRTRQSNRLLFKTIVNFSIPQLNSGCHPFDLTFIST